MPPAPTPSPSTSSRVPGLTFLLREAVAGGRGGAGAAGRVGVLVLAAGGQRAGGEGAGAGEEHVAGQARLQAGRVGKAGLPTPAAQALVRQRPLQALLWRLLPRQGWEAGRPARSRPGPARVAVLRGFFPSWTSAVFTQPPTISAPFLVNVYSDFLLGIPPTRSAAHLILERRPHPPAPGEVREGRGDPSWSLRASHWWGPCGTECWLPPELRLVGGNPGETAATQVPTGELAANKREAGTRGKSSRACVKGLRTPAVLARPPLGHKSLNAPWAPRLHSS